MDGRVKRGRQKAITEELSAKPGEVVQYQEYKGYMIIKDTETRIVLAERGLYVTEFITRYNDDVDLAVAKEYIDNVR